MKNYQLSTVFDMKRILYTALICCTAVLTPSCVDDLNQYPHTETTSENIYHTRESYFQVLSKIYTAMVTNGQEKNGSADLSTNNGQDYSRCLFNLQEVCTDEVAYTWLSGENLTAINDLSWDANDSWVSDMYYRIYYNIALCNEFLRHATDEAIGGFSAEDQTEIRRYRAEARFLRALFYYHAMDFFRNIPFVTENDPVGSYIPPRYTAQQIFDFIEDELNDITEGSDLLFDRSECPYGRASKGAAYTLLAKMYLNAEVYINEKKCDECIAACGKAIAQGYTLEPEYGKLFNADNHLRTNEIIFTLPIDAATTVSWGAGTYMVCGEISNTSSTEDYSPARFGATNGWGNMRIRRAASALFDSDDLRGQFYTTGQTQEATDLSDLSTGYLVTKWTNLTDDGQSASNTAQDGANTDYPLFRLADVYLMYGEAVARGGQGGDAATALGYVNDLRERAFGNDSENVTEADLTTDFYLDERCRELYWESTRRTDLIRFNKFTTADYLWEWKGGSANGTSVDSKFNIYPIPSTELTANPNLYNENY